MSEVETAAIREKLAPEIDKTLERLIKLRDSDDEPVALRACSDILDRFYGKPRQDVNLAGEAPIHLEVTGAAIIGDSEAREHARELRRRVGAARQEQPGRTRSSH